MPLLTVESESGGGEWLQAKKANLLGIGQKFLMCHKDIRLFTVYDNEISIIMKTCDTNIIDTYEQMDVG